jgi:hypothetical protein
MPSGDSYLYFVYTQNLVDFQEFSFNPGLREGIGTTSFLWVAILTVLYWIGIPPIISAKILGIVFWGFSGCLLYDLTLQGLFKQEHNQRVVLATLVALIGILSGSIVWIALSGMETLLFISLCLLSFWLYTKEKWFTLGVSLGLLALTRIEGIILAGVLIAIEIIYHRRISKTHFQIALPILFLLVPWMGYLTIREGVPITSSFQGRQVVIFEVDKHIAYQFPQLAWALKVPPLIHFFCWFVFVIIHVTGISIVSGPSLRLESSLLGAQLSFPLIGLLVVSIICFPLIIIAFKYLYEQRGRFKKSDHFHRVILIAGIWLFAHNLAYALFLPQVGSAGRYALMNHIGFWLLLFIGIFALRNRYLKLIASFATITLLGISLSYWNSIYKANVDYQINVRIPAARFIDEEISQDKVVGATDLGVLKYYSSQHIVDLFGHVNPEYVGFRNSGGTWADYLSLEEVCYLVLFDSIETNGLDFTREMKLNDDSRFDLEKEVTFSISPEEWLFGNGPHQNYMPAMSIYRVIWHNEDACQ